MQQLEALYKVTQQLKEILDQPIAAKNRDAIIEEVNVLIEKRGGMMEKVIPPFTEKEKTIGKEIVALNKQIEEKMESLFAAIKQDMRQVNKQKESNRTYINPYRNTTSTDGMYHDSKQ